MVQVPRVIDRIYCHVVWKTRDRRPLIDAGVARFLCGFLRAVAAQENFDKLMLRVNQWIMDGMKKGSASPIITLS